MTSREENEQRPLSRSSGLASIVPRDDSPRSQAAREPISMGEMPDGEGMAPRPEESLNDMDEEQKEEISDLMLNVIMHPDRPIENLPVMMAPELKLIGRCVSLRVMQTVNGAPPASYYYTGLVCMVTETSVSLMQVNRYTHDDFAAYYLREQQLSKGATISPELQIRNCCALRHGRVRACCLYSVLASPRADNGDASSTQHAQSPEWDLLNHDCTTAGEAGATQDDRIVSTEDSRVLCTMDAAGSLAPAVPLKTAAELDAAAAQNGDEAGRMPGVTEPVVDEVTDSAGAANGGTAPRRFRAFDGSIGPIPYVTFLRKSIHNVAFGRDPHSSFYSLFKDPAMHIRDMQLLCMFVRCYLVHTSQGNNPRQVLLYAFLSVRCAWPDVDRELVNRVALEELPALLKADCAIEKEKKRRRLREQQRVREVQEYRAPAGFFSNTGILYLTKIPQNLFLAGMFILLFDMGLIVFFSAAKRNVSDALISSFIFQFMGELVAAIVVWSITGVICIVHATMMHLPVREGMWYTGAHIVCFLAAVVCSIMAFVVLLRLLDRNTIFFHMVRNQPDELCPFYERHGCSGFFEGCNDTDNIYNQQLCSTCPGVNTSITGCYPIIRSRIGLTTMPLIVFSIFVTLAVLYSFFQLFKLLEIFRAAVDLF
ncbi:hypothetical protein, conserved [Leishmania lindenbergi]|uniref:Uncharacterized protein n=1 Tax=Leishmania lindenbergi TaxID=651832 RepID=A0AAW3A1C2_9TRYP